MRFVKIRDKFKKSRVRERLQKSSKILLPIFFVVVLGSPLHGHAEELPTCPNTPVPESRLHKGRELVLSIVGLKKCLDPCATPIQKAIACSRPCCIIAGLTAGCIAENSPIGSKMHNIASICCASTWTTYAVLYNLDREKLGNMPNK